MKPVFIVLSGFHRQQGLMVVHCRGGKLSNVSSSLLSYHLLKGAEKEQLVLFLETLDPTQNSNSNTEQCINIFRQSWRIGEFVHFTDS